MLIDEQFIDALSAIQHQLEGNMANLLIADAQFPESKDVQVHSFSFLFIHIEYMWAKENGNHVEYMMVT